MGPLFIDLSGTELTPEEEKLLAMPQLGGIILFSRNYKNPIQLTHLTDEINNINSKLLITVDHEGGRVQRFRYGFTALPPMQKLGKLFSEDAKKAQQIATDIGWLIAIELQACGVDFSFTPVLDLDVDRSTVIGDRAFSEDHVITSALSSALMVGLKLAGMAAVGKHFPGHGGVIEDSHIELPVDYRSYAQLEEKDLIPFMIAVKEGIEGIMPAHVLYPNIAPEPAGFSAFWLQQTLRQKLNFNGLIFSDDLSMEGANTERTPDIVSKASAALKAGCDALLLCNDRSAVHELLIAWEKSPNTIPFLPSHTWLQRHKAMFGKGKKNNWEDLIKMDQYVVIRDRILEL